VKLHQRHPFSDRQDDVDVVHFILNHSTFRQSLIYVAAGAALQNTVTMSRHEKPLAIEGNGKYNYNYAS